MSDHDTRCCKKCGVERHIEDFPRYEGGRRRHECITCYRARMHLHYDKHRETRKAKARAQYAANPSAYWTPERRNRANEMAIIRNRVLREEVIGHYGARCVACGESEPLFLTLDHVENDGMHMRENVHGKGSSGIYRWIKKNGFPESFQVLCMNCNFGKARNGGVLVRDIRKGRFNDYPERE